MSRSACTARLSAGLAVLVLVTVSESSEAVPSVVGEGVPVHQDGFERGDSCAWSSEVPPIPVNCSDAIQNGCETDVDCGGRSCGGCGFLESCLVDDDCLSGICYLGQCELQYLLTVDRSGEGTVTSTPSGIDCGVACSALFDAGTSVALAATPDTGAIFLGWTGACSGLGDCTPTVLPGGVLVGAAFELQPETTITRQPPPGASNDPSLTWEFSSSIAGSTFECTVNAVVTGCTSPHSATFGDGTTNSFSVVAIAPGGARDATPASGTATTINTLSPLLVYELNGDPNNTGLLVGFDGAAAGVTYPAGKFGLAAHFDGSAGAEIRMSGLGPVWGSTSSDWTLSIWFQELAPGVGNAKLFDFRTFAPNLGWATYHSAASPPTSLITCSGGSPPCDSFANPAYFVWHSLVWEYDAASYSTGAAVSIYLDGDLDASINGTSPIVLFGAAMTQLALGNALGGGGASLFYLDRFKVYNRAFSASDRCTQVIGGTYTGSSCTLP